MRRRRNRRRRYNKNACLNANFLCERAAFSARFSYDFYCIFRQKQTVFAIFLIPIHVAEHILICMQYFGTDGIRQKADYLLDKQIPYLLGKALSQSGAKVIVARDVRTHSKEIENNCAKGCSKALRRFGLQAFCQRPRLHIPHKLKKRTMR